MNGKNTSQTKLVLKFNDELKNFFNIPIVLEDERLTSLHAKKSLVFQGFKQLQIRKILILRQQRCYCKII